MRPPAGRAARIRAAVAVALLALLGLGAADVGPSALRPAPVPAPVARGDLGQIAARALAVDPALRPGSALRRRFASLEHRLAASVRGPLAQEVLLRREDRLLAYLGDPATGLTALPTPDLLPLGFYWAAGGLVVYRVAGTPAQVRTGDRVLSVGGRTPRRLAGALEDVVGGGPAWRRAEAQRLLPLGSVLRGLGAERAGAVRLVLRRPAGGTYALTLPLAPMDLQAERAYLDGLAAFANRFEAPPGLPEPGGAAPFAWEVSRAYGVFWLTACSGGPALRRAVDRFFAAVAAQGTTRIVLDLEGNAAGSAAAAARPLLDRLALRPGRRGAGSGGQGRFAGQVYVLTSGSTAGPGLELAEQLTGAAYGVPVGVPSDGRSNLYGPPRTYLTPDGLAAYSVSTRPAPAQGGARSAVRPVLDLPLTAADVARGVDPVARWLGGFAPPPAHT